MDVLFLMSIFRLYPGLKVSIKNKSVCKNFLKGHVFVGILDFIYVRLTKILSLVEPLVMGTRTWSFHFVISKYLGYTQYYMMLLEQFGHIVVKDLVTAT